MAVGVDLLITIVDDAVQERLLDGELGSPALNPRQRRFRLLELLFTGDDVAAKRFGLGLEGSDLSLKGCAFAFQIIDPAGCLGEPGLGGTFGVGRGIELGLKLGELALQCGPLGIGRRRRLVGLGLQGRHALLEFGSGSLECSKPFGRAGKIGFRLVAGGDCRRKLRLEPGDVTARHVARAVSVSRIVSTAVASWPSSSAFVACSVSF